MRSVQTIWLFTILCSALTQGAGALRFTSAQSYPVGTGPLSIATGDFNHDGFQDLAVANAGSSTVSILLGRSDSTFKPAVNYPVGQAPQSIVAADFNANGALDLAVANWNSSNVSVLLGRGDGTFSDAVNYPVGRSPSSIAAGDFDADHKLDLVVANAGGSTISILKGRGDGSFNSATTVNVGSAPNSVATGDFNRDGKLDVAVANAGSSSVSILKGNGNGTFQAPVNTSVGFLSGGITLIPHSLAVGDFNRDGKLDLATTTRQTIFNRQVKVLLGNGNGTFQTPIAYSTGLFPTFVVAADFNHGTGLLSGPSALDLATSDVFRATVNVLLGAGQASPAFQAFAFPSAARSQSIAATDLNADHVPDLVVANTAANTVSVLLNRMGVKSSLHSSLNPPHAGQTFTLSFTIRASVPGSGTPTGEVFFIIDSIEHVRRVSLSSGTASLPLSLPAGTHHIRAACRPTNDFVATQSNLTLAIVP